MSISEDLPEEANSVDPIAQLTEENEKLKNLIADIYGVLNEVEPNATSDDMFDAIDEACDYMITDLPDEYQYEEDSGDTSVSSDQTQEAADELNDPERIALDSLRSRLANELGIDENELENIRDPNIGLPALRRSLIKELTSSQVSDLEVTPEEYEAAVATQFFWLFIFSATPPYSYKKEAERYLRTFRTIKARIPKGKRRPAPEVQKALDMLAQGRTWAEIDEQFRPELKGRERKEAFAKLRQKTESLLAIRKRRGQSE